MYFVYLLICNKGKTYIGCTSNLNQRLGRHQKGQVPATKDRLPVKVKCYFAFKNKYLAYKFEKYLKTGSGRAWLKRRMFN